MAFVLKSGKVQTEWYTRKESVTYTPGDLVYFLQTDPGYAIPADATSGNHIGVNQKAMNSSKSDYATTNQMIPVLVPSEDAIFEADVSGTLATTHVGEYWDLSYAGTVNVAASAKRVVLCVGYISATKGLFKINSAAYHSEVTTT